MRNDEPIEQTLDRYVAEGRIDASLQQSIRQLLETQQKDNYMQALASLYRSQFGADKHYRRFVHRAKSSGQWFAIESDLERASQKLTHLLDEASQHAETNYSELVGHLSDPQDADLYAAFVLNIPQVREEVKKQIGTYDRLYRVTSRILREKRKRSGPKFKEDRLEKSENSSSDDLLRQVVQRLPEHYFASLCSPAKKGRGAEEYEAKQRLFTILQEKVRRDCFRKFNLNDPRQMLTELEEIVARENNENLRVLYASQLHVFKRYLAFQEEVRSRPEVNRRFENPATNEVDVLPSFHQVVAMYHNLEEKRFGIFDDCGTGKTAIAALLQALILEKKKAEGKTVQGRTLVIGPKSSSKAWRDALEGAVSKRYFTDAQKTVFFNGEKDGRFLDRLQEADFIFANYEQLTLNFNGEKVYELLINLGYDHLIVDEVQEAKKTGNLTSRGKVTESMAVRLLATNAQAEYISLLSGTPMPDNLNDYANIFFILCPEYFTENVVGAPRLDYENIERRFMEIYEGDPRALYALVRKKTIRRRSAEVTELPGTELREELVELTPVQRQIVDYVFEHGARDWLTQMRYAVLDPRLVSPKILTELQLIGKVSRADSAKYRRLEELLADESGPLAQGEKIVIFSSMFAEGVTRPAASLQQEYQQLGLGKEFKKLKLRTLKEDLEELLGKKLGRRIVLQAIDAMVPDKEREAAVDRLGDGLDGIICTTLSGGVSLNFSPATHTYFLDEHYSPAATEQGIARTARRGQRRKNYIHFLYGKDSIDLDVKSLLEQKRENIQMALDGIEMLEKEKEILWGGHDQERLKELMIKRRGGLGIDLSSYEISKWSDFEVKKVLKRRDKDSRLIIVRDLYEPTVAQEIREAIMHDPVGIWHDADFVEKYCQNFEALAPYLLARAKVVDLVKRSKTHELPWPTLLLADAAGQGILYSAFDAFTKLLAAEKRVMPVVVDRDFSRPMHEASPNPHKYVADMCGKPRVFDEQFFQKWGHRFDFVDNSSLTLLENRSRIRDYILEANRVMSLGGHLQLGIGGWHFSDQFFEGMEQAGFEPVVRSVRHNVAKGLVKALRERYSPHYAEAYRSKLEATTFSIFKKIAEKDKAEEKYFLLENPEARGGPEPERSELEREKVKHDGSEEEERGTGSVTISFTGKKAVGESSRKGDNKYSGKFQLVRDPKTGVVIVDSRGRK